MSVERKPLEFRQLWKGIVSNTTMFQYLCIVLMVFGSFLVLAGVNYSVPFNFITVCVSNLGNPTLNPRGWGLFTIAMVFGGISLLPFFNYIVREMDVKFHPVLYPWALLFYVGAFGMMGVGIFNEAMGSIHYVFAIAAFGGLILAMLISIIIMVYRIINQYPRPNLKKFALSYAIDFIIGGLAIREIIMNGTQNAQLLFLAEWYAFFFVLVWLFALLVITK